MNLTVFIVDDDEAARRSLTFMMRGEGFICRSYSSATTFLAQLTPEHRGCIITDVRMPHMDGIALVHRLNEIGAKIPVVVITGHADVPLAVKAMKAGIVDFIEKPFESETIIAAVRKCLEISKITESRQSSKISIEKRMSTLTEREKQVLEALYEGNTNKEIALILNISPRTVEVYRANIMSKMQADGLSNLVRMLILTKAA